MVSAQGNHMASQFRYDDMPSLARCAACSATVIAEAGGGVRADANTVCTACGMTLVEPPYEGGDYFGVVMRVNRPLSRAARPRRNEYE
jgi:ribosomal protein S27E